MPYNIIYELISSKNAGPMIAADNSESNNTDDHPLPDILQQQIFTAEQQQLQEQAGNVHLNVEYTLIIPSINPAELQQMVSILQSSAIVAAEQNPNFPQIIPQAPIVTPVEPILIKAHKLASAGFVIVAPGLLNMDTATRMLVFPIIMKHATLHIRAYLLQQLVATQEQQLIQQSS